MADLSQPTLQTWQRALLDSIHIVMVNTTLPANIGSVARAMHTMGLEHLTVVSPKKPLDDDAYAFSAGGRHILDNMKVVVDLPQAIGEINHVFATSSRQRHIPKPVLSPRQSAVLLVNGGLKHLQQQQALPKIAFVFGREDRGLTNDELRLADYHVQIPANPDYSVLNVAMAMQVIASVLYEEIENATVLQDLQNNQHAHIDLTIRQTWDEPAINQAQKQQLEQRLLNLLSQLTIYDPNQSKVMPERVNRLLGRLQLDVKEYQLLQAMIAKINQRLEQ